MQEWDFSDLIDNFLMKLFYYFPWFYLKLVDRNKYLWKTKNSFSSAFVKIK